MGHRQGEENLTEYRVHLNFLQKVLFASTDVKPESIWKHNMESECSKPPRTLLFAITRIILVAAHLPGHLTWRGLVAGAEPLPLA